MRKEESNKYPRIKKRAHGTEMTPETLSCAEIKWEGETIKSQCPLLHELTNLLSGNSQGQESREVHFGASHHYQHPTKSPDHRNLHKQAMHEEESAPSQCKQIRRSSWESQFPKSLESQLPNCTQPPSHQPEMVSSVLNPFLQSWDAFQILSCTRFISVFISYQNVNSIKARTTLLKHLCIRLTISHALATGTYLTKEDRREEGNE